MSSMAEMGQTSSMTSVTEEDTSADSESDTTESSYSNITSSVLSSTDTDDKLTPGLINISISSTASTVNSPTKKKSSQQYEEGMDQDPCEVSTVVVGSEQAVSGQCNFTNGAPEIMHDSGAKTGAKDPEVVFAYGSNPLPLEHAKHHKRRLWKNTSSSLTHGTQKFPRNCVPHPEENMGVDDPDNKLSTDLSDTSSVQAGGDRSNNNEFEVESNEDEQDRSDSRESENHRSFHPDMTSASWYQAQCFDRYWAHYSFVMDWYQEHVKAVRTLQEQMIGSWRFPQAGRYTLGSQQSRNESSRRKKRSRRTRSRRSTRSRQRASEGSSVSVGSVSTASADTDGLCQTHTSSSSDRRSRRLNNSKNGEEQDVNLEMEITDEMMEFFATSFKHRMERDCAKNETSDTQLATRLNIEDAKAGEQAPSSAAPSERPGVRRTAEMKELYGTGAAMIHGMETALQMTFDRISDKFQPKSWPNMPLKIMFA